MLRYTSQVARIFNTHIIFIYVNESTMNKILTLGMPVIFILITGCTTNTPPQQTGVGGQFVVTSIHNHSIFSSLEGAKFDTESMASAYCSKLNKKFKKNYSIDHGMAIGQVVESTLYFECVDSIE